jgi:PIN domain nuclease of toxin-antitoxin system
MKVLVDTHAFFWWVTDDPQLSIDARNLLTDVEGEVAISAVVAWELATKARIGKWPGASELVGRLDGIIEDNTALVRLPITLGHAREAGLMPGSHRDPFDRMLAAQAQIEDIPLVSADPVFRTFGVRVIW